MIAIPAIDLINNEVVRLFQGDYKQQTAYPLDPVEYAIEIMTNGLEYLHLVDLSGAKAGKLVHQSILEQIVSQTALKVDFGGGIKTEGDIRHLLKSGATQVVIGSLCVRDPEKVMEWIETFGTERFILALDIDGNELKINGWQDASGKTLEEIMRRFSRFKGLTILTTDIRRDGTGSGPNVDLYEKLVRNFPDQRWIASGGTESLQNLEKLRKAGCYGCVIGKALLEGKITLKELKSFNDAGL
ncbi:1-(5-phosphoribosyl)-5-[(5-phosphoribosylamino)methylideneamino] imidazole-4-carboxamide isomerase [Fluviicola sp.]|uniref:1-(5-phosphoribosyl)-5-[(5- phosphoribosylamino)methylideneamino]imidazole-4- carboxamide isomerase n=1 Tax=Fluviicola sp. TaxID=1917219 RepID=UPI0031CE3353